MQCLLLRAALCLLVPSWSLAILRSRPASLSWGGRCTFRSLSSLLSLALRLPQSLRAPSLESMKGQHRWGWMAELSGRDPDHSPHPTCSFPLVSVSDQAKERGAERKGLRKQKQR